MQQKLFWHSGYFSVDEYVEKQDKMFVGYKVLVFSLVDFIF